MRAGAAEVYEHEMPGGQYTNLRQQARALGIEARWREVARAYADVNRMFGDIVKVTPTSKVVGDLAVFMVTNDLTPEEVLDPDREIAFPDSVVEYFHGDLGQPYGGFPEDAPAQGAEGRRPAHRAARRGAAARRPRRPRAPRSRRRCAARSATGSWPSYLMYPKVFIDFAEHQRSLRRRERAADAGLLLRPAPATTSCSSTSSAARPWSSASWRSARPTTRASARSSSSSTASRAR